MPATTIIGSALVAILFLLGAVSTQPVLGEETPPCAEDLASFCKDVKPGGGRIISCLMKHEGKLSPVCKNKLQELREKIDEVKQACTADIEKFCRGIEPGEGRIARCFEEHAPELSPACAEKLDWLKAKMKGK